MFVLGVVIGVVIKKRKAKENDLTVERNVEYGLAEYYEDTEVVDRNDYYKKTSGASSSVL